MQQGFKKCKFCAKTNLKAQKFIQVKPVTKIWKQKLFAATALLFLQNYSAMSLFYFLLARLRTIRTNIILPTFDPNSSPIRSSIAQHLIMVLKESMATLAMLKEFTTQLAASSSLNGPVDSRGTMSWQFQAAVGLSNNRRMCFINTNVMLEIQNNPA